MYVKPTWAPVGCRKNRTTSVSGVFWEENIGSGSLKGQHLSHIYSGNGEMYWFYTCLRTYWSNIMAIFGVYSQTFTKIMSHSGILRRKKNMEKLQRPYVEKWGGPMHVVPLLDPHINSGPSTFFMPSFVDWSIFSCDCPNMRVRWKHGWNAQKTNLGTKDRNLTAVSQCLTTTWEGRVCSSLHMAAKPPNASFRWLFPPSSR